jgi:hypothetical protein
MRGPLRRVREWWRGRGGKGKRLFGILGRGDDGTTGSGVREPRRPRTPSLSGAAAVDVPQGPDEPRA